MPSLSQTLTFVPMNTPLSTATSSVVYPNTGSTTLTFISEKVKGDGYFGSSDGFHTVQYTATQDFYGTVTMQATLAVNPINSDWFTISGTNINYTPLDVRNTSTVNLFNFTGNFVWVRGYISINAGAIENILYNH